MARLPRIRRDTLRADATAGLVLGVQSVPDGLATGLLAGANPLAGLYGYLAGTIAGAAATSSVFMVVQGTGAMAMIVADVPAVHSGSDPERALFTLSVVTGAVMIVAGVLKLGTVLRFVSRAVMVGFINAVGVNIILGQLGSFTGYDSDGANRVTRAIDTLLHPGRLDPQTVAVGVTTIVLIVVLERTRLKSLGLVLAVVITSGMALALGWDGVATLNDVAKLTGSLPRPQLPLLRLVPSLLVPAASLAFVGLVQGSAISSAFPNPDGSPSDASHDFVGQGVANVASGFLQGMPVGGSVSASALNKGAGARSRQAALIAGLVMAIVIVAFAPAIGRVSMPALAGLLMLIGFRTIKPADLRAVWRVGVVQKVVVTVTFALTMLIRLQFAVLLGVVVSLVLYVLRQSNQVVIRRRTIRADGEITEGDPPVTLPAGEVVVLQPYGSLFFAAAPVFESSLPELTEASRHTVVILRLRGRTDIGTTLIDVLRRYARALHAIDSKLVVVSASDRIVEQLTVTDLLDVLGGENVYPGDERVGATLRRAHQDAEEWVAARRAGSGSPE